MPDKEISALTPADLPLTGEEVMQGIQGVNSRRFTTQDIADLVVVESGLVPPLAANFPTVINSPVVTDGPKSLLMKGAAASSVVRGIFQDLPGGDFSVIAKIRALGIANFNSAGIAFRGTDGKYITAGYVHVTGHYIEITQWSSSTAMLNGSASLDLGESALPSWYKADFDEATSDVTLSVSFCGTNWHTLGTSTYLGTANAVGIALGCRNAGTPPVAWFEHFEIVPAP